MADILHPARLILSSAVPAEEYRKKFIPTISTTPDLPAINWNLLGQDAPTLLESTADLPSADVVVITWAEAEWAPLHHVFCASGSPMPYNRRNESEWDGWKKYSVGVPSGLDYWGYYCLVKVVAAEVLLFKSNAHYAAYEGESNLQALIDLLVETVKPTLILSVGTAGGARATDPIGTVNVVNADTLYQTTQPQDSWPEYLSPWVPNWEIIASGDFEKLLLSVPTTNADLEAIAVQFNQFYATTYSLSELNPQDLNLAAATPAVNNLALPNTALLTAKSFVVANTSGNLSNFACVEMDDAILAKALIGKVAFGSVRNISDPIQNVSLPDIFQGRWGEAIYTAYGFYTSFNGALAAWGLLASQFGSDSVSAAGGRMVQADSVVPPEPALTVPRLAAAALHRTTAQTRRVKARDLASRNDAEAHRLRGRARLLAATHGAPTKVLRVDVTNVYCGSDYTAELSVGTNGSKANVILDTGSSTLALEPSVYNGEGDTALKPSTLLQLVTYGTGGWAGPVIKTSVTVGAAEDQLPLTDCPLALTSVQEQGNFRGVGGILGLAYNGLNNAWDFRAYLEQKRKTATYPWPFGSTWSGFETGFTSLIRTADASETNPLPYFDQLEEAGIVANKFAFYTLRSFVCLRAGTSIEALLDDPLNKGIFVLGGGEEEQDLYEGDFSSVSVVHDVYYNTNLKSVRVEGSAAKISAPLQQQYRQTAVSNSIIDSGTSNLSLATDVYEAILQGLRQCNPAFSQTLQAAGENGISAAEIDLSQWPNIYFEFDGEDGAQVELLCTPQTYWQTDFPAAGRAVFQISGPVDEAVNQSIFGLPLLNNYYTIFDRSQDINGVIRFAKIKPLV